ncbi:spermatogenesis-associated protein 7 isoform X2 [Cynocephalus volans]|uniref:spermatogenesis-associated protein 7 isoform X2 n=1 Tax=Cynocephalus volans TaxID=110931 RepID=UPI002FC73796
MDGSRRVRATSVLPRYGSPCLFKGHLSTKSNAAVDCSVPVSVSASIKYADQQRREKLKKELARCEKEFKLNKTAMQAHSKNNSKLLFNTLRKPSGEPQDQNDVLIEEMNGFSSLARSLVPSSERLHLNLPKSNKALMNGTENNSTTSLSSMDYTASRPRKQCSGTTYGRRPRSAFPNSHQFQLVISKAPSGDLLDKHSELFSNKQLPFTPRTLKTEAKSFLSQYRYYTPAKRRKDFTDQRMEAETQTELSSFQSDLGAAETKNLTDSEVNINQASNSVTNDTKGKITPLPLQGDGLRWNEIKDGAPQHFSGSEEELLYLSFIEDVTDDILKLGLFSNRFLERLFERHIKQNKHLEEGKMRHLLHVLKVDLGCTPEESSVKLNDVDTLTILDFEKAGNSEQNECKNGHEVTIQQERQEYQKALDMLVSAPKEEHEIFSSPSGFFMPIYKSKCSEGVIVQQVSDETNLEPSTWDENNPSISDSLIDQETSVNVIEGDSDTEKVETSNELCCLSTSLPQSVQFCSINGDNNYDLELPILKIMEMNIED